MCGLFVFLHPSLRSRLSAVVDTFHHNTLVRRILRPTARKHRHYLVDLLDDHPDVFGRAFVGHKYFDRPLVVRQLYALYFDVETPSPVHVIEVYQQNAGPVCVLDLRAESERDDRLVEVPVPPVNRKNVESD